MTKKNQSFCEDSQGKLNAQLKLVNLNQFLVNALVMKLNEVTKQRTIHLPKTAKQLKKKYNENLNMGIFLKLSYIGPVYFLSC